MTAITIRDGGSHLEFRKGNLTLDIGVDKRKGYLIYARSLADGVHQYEIAHKLRHVIGKRVTSPSAVTQKPETRITEENLCAEIEKALA